MTRRITIDRSTMLRGVGTAIALPMLETMMPLRAAAAEDSEEAPRRLAFFFVPNGVHMPHWTPEQEGADFTLPPTLEPLADFQEDLLLFTGLAQDKARANGDGPGDHARAGSVFLTGCQPNKTDGADIRIGVSVDQIAAQQIGQQTKFASLELGCDRGAQSGNCDSGYSCAYSSNISWRTPNTPMAKEVDPRLVFERLFGVSHKTEVAGSLDQRRRFQKSVLDFVLDDASRLRKKLPKGDQRKMDEYLTSVREIEMRISRVELGLGDDQPNIAAPVGIPKNYGAHIRLLLDLLVLSFQSDRTRVSTFMFANAGSNRSYKFIDVPEGHHDLSHHGNDEAKQAKISLINRFHMEQFSYFLGRMQSAVEGEGTLLDNSILLYGSGIGDGNRHNHHDLPILVAGSGGGRLSTGRHIRYPTNTPLNNLYLSLLDRMDVKIESLGDSTARLPGLEV